MPDAWRASYHTCWRGCRQGRKFRHPESWIIFLQCFLLANLWFECKLWVRRDICTFIVHVHRQRLFIIDEWLQSIALMSATWSPQSNIFLMWPSTLCSMMMKVGATWIARSITHRNLFHLKGVDVGVEGVGEPGSGHSIFIGAVVQLGIDCYCIEILNHWHFSGSFSSLNANFSAIL